MKTRQDQSRRSQQGWERGRGAKRIGNPRYKPVTRNGCKTYVLRKGSTTRRTVASPKRNFFGGYKL